MNYIGDSIVGEHCNFGAGTITANWRFDEQPISVMVNESKLNTGMDKLGAIIGDNCRTGINVSIMPGVKIGPNSIIEPSVNLTENVSSYTIKSFSGSVRPFRKSIEYGQNEEK